MRKPDKKIVLEDGEEYYGYGFGANKEAVCEIVFNTSMVGYQEIISDPSYTYQMVVMTYPLIRKLWNYRWRLWNKTTNNRRHDSKRI